MRIVQNVADEFVVHSQTVKEIIGAQNGVSKFFAYFGFNVADGSFKHTFFKTVSNHKNINAARISFAENAGKNNQFKPAGFLQFFKKLAAGNRGSVQNKILKRID